MASGRFTDRECRKLVAYIAVNNPGTRNRAGNKLYQQLVETTNWAKSRSWSAWRQYYKNHQEELDRRIAEYQHKHDIAREAPPQTHVASRSHWTSEEEEYLVEFLAKYAPLKVPGQLLSKFGRSGNYIYRVILSDPDEFKWAATRTWISWRERYTKNQAKFDKRIARWQELHHIDPDKQIMAIQNEYRDRHMSKYPMSEGTEVVAEEKEEQLDGSDREQEITQNGNKRPRSEDDANDKGQAGDIARSAKKQKLMPLKSPSHAHYELEMSRGGLDLREAPDKCTEVDGNSGNDDGIIALDGNGSGLSRGNLGNMSPSPATLPSPIIDTPRTALDASNPPIGSAGPPLYRSPTSPSHTPSRIPTPPGIDIEKTPRNIQASVAPSHPPTPPPTNIQSDGSVLSLSLEPDPPSLSAVAESGHRAESPVAPSRSSLSPSNAHSLDISNTSNLPCSMPLSDRSTPRSSAQSIETLVAPHGPHLRSPSQSSVSDGPFGTSPPSPRRTEVIRGLPKRHERSFRDNVRVRTRNVIVEQQHKSPEGGQRENKTGNNLLEDKSPWLPLKRKPSGSGQGFQVATQSLSPTSISSVPDTVKTVTATHAAKSAVSSDLSQHFINRVDSSIHKAPNTTPPANSRTNNRGFLDKVGGHKPSEQTDDVFTNVASITSASNHDPYVLGTSHLPPEPGTGLTSLRINTSTPVLQGRKQRRHKRRRTFTGFSLSAGLPNIDLLAELKVKGVTRSPGLVWTKKSPEITILSQSESRPTSPRLLLSDVDRAIARRGRPRKSVIPIVVDTTAGSSTTVSLDQLSPSTSDIIFKEGLAASFKRLEMNHGFSIDVIRRIWLHQDLDLHETDKKLLRMRLAAEKAIDGDEDDTPSDLKRAPREPGGPIDNERVIAHSNKDPTPTDYTPPVRSRAGHYRRFLEQGRHWDARQREIDLASRRSATIPSTKSAASPIWSEREDGILRSGSEVGLRELANKFGEKFLRKKSLALLVLDG